MGGLSSRFPMAGLGVLAGRASLALAPSCLPFPCPWPHHAFPSLALAAARIAFHALALAAARIASPGPSRIPHREPLP